MSKIQNSIEYAAQIAVDPFQKHILQKEVLKIPVETEVAESIHRSKWYRQLADEQWEDGSWGRFHSMDSHVPGKQKFVTTEAALRRMHELALTKDDPMVLKSVQLMERYVRGEETWSDNVEKHHDNGKSHLHSRFFLSAADLSQFDPLNPAILPYRDICVKQLEKAFATDAFDEKAWMNDNLDYTGICLEAYMVYPLWLVQNTDCLSDELQRKYLNYIWNRQKGIYYISHSSVSQKLSLEDKGFTTWLSALEALSGFSLFGEFMKDGVYDHLISEMERLMKSEISLPPAHPITGHYAENWRDKNARKSDMLLRILRILVKCKGGNCLEKTAG